MANRRGAKWRAVRVATVAIFAVAIPACGDRQQVDSAAATDNIAAAGEAAPLLQKWCTDCHLVPPAASHKVQEWRYIVLRMQGHRIAGGLGEIDKSDLERLISYFENHALHYFLDSWFGAAAGDAARGLRQFRSIFPAANMGRRADRARDAAAAARRRDERIPGARDQGPRQTRSRPRRLARLQYYG